MTRIETKLTALSALGGALEFYDFVIYILFATYISQNFFPSTDPLASLLSTYSVFVIGYLGRPLGALFFGHLGDRYGRKNAFTLASFLMAVATFSIGCLPTYDQIGISATIFLILLRIVQGISLGGEIGGVTVFVMEHVNPAKKGLAGGLVFMAGASGNVFGSLLGALLAYFLSTTELFTWGWRVPFWIGCLLSLVAYFIRRKTLETPVFLALTEEAKPKLPAAKLFREAFPEILCSICLTAIPGGAFAVLMYLPSYLSLTQNLPLANSFLNNVAAFLVVSLFSAYFGFISDFTGRKSLMMFCSLLLIALSYFLFQIFILSQQLLIFNLILAFIAAISNGIYALMIAEQFPTEIRYSGMAFAFNIGITFFAGIAPLACLYLFRLAHTIYAPVYFLFFCGLISFLGAFFAKPSLVSSHQPILD